MSDPSVVTFDPVAFRTEFAPAFDTLSDAQLTNAFNLATLYLNNTPCSQVQDPTQLSMLLNLLTAHMAQLLYGINGQPPTGLVGRVSDATEGSVSVGTDIGNLPFNAQWFAQTQYGFTFWQLTSIYRRARYFPGRSGPAPGPNFRRTW